MQIGRSCFVGLVAALLFAGCGTTRWSPTVGATYVIADDYEVELSTFSGSVTGDTEYSSFEVLAGVTGARADGGKVVRPEFRVGVAEFLEVDAIEVAGGARLYAFGGPVSPYVSLHGVYTVLEEIDGFDLGTQLGMRFGVGLEVDLTSWLFLDIGGDYLLPLVPAESDYDPFLLDRVETELSGFALRVGAGFRF